MANPVSEKIDTALGKIDPLIDRAKEMESFMLSREKPDPEKVAVANKTVTVLKICRDTLSKQNGYAVEDTVENTPGSAPTLS